MPTTIDILTANGQQHLDLLRVGDWMGRTPLHNAASRGNVAAVNKLLESDASCVNLRDNSGVTPLALAAGTGQPTVVECLLGAAGVDANARDSHLRTPLAVAAAQGRTEVIETLVRDARVDLHALDERGMLPWQVAAAEGRLPAMEKLLQLEGHVEYDLSCKGLKQGSYYLQHYYLRVGYSYAACKVIFFSLKVCRLNIREVRGGDVPNHWGGMLRAFGIGFSSTPTHPPTLPTQSLQPKTSLPIGPGTSPHLTSLILG